MSPENVEVVTALLGAYNAGDLMPAGDEVVVRIDWRAGGHGPSGRIVRVAMFWDHEEALAAAGLPDSAIT